MIESVGRVLRQAVPWKPAARRAGDPATLDNAKEFLVYAHAARGPKDVLAQIEEISQRTTKGKDLVVVLLGPDGASVVAVLTDGQFFGELSLLSSQPRNATLKAVDYCELYSLDKKTFERVLETFPEFREHIDRVASERLSNAGPPRPTSPRGEEVA